jgi:hypothetical protein
MQHAPHAEPGRGSLSLLAEYHIKIMTGKRTQNETGSSRGILIIYFE